MSKVLNQISRSPFTHRIEGGRLPRRFTQPMFTMYNGQTDPVKHVSHFNQRMAMHSKNKALMCKIFLSSLRPVAMRWFDGLGANSIDSFKEITQAFGSCFLHAAGFLNLQTPYCLWPCEGETLKSYSDRQQEIFNQINGDFDNVTIRIFKVGLLVEHSLRKSLTRKPATSVR